MLVLTALRPCQPRTGRDSIAQGALALGNGRRRMSKAPTGRDSRVIATGLWLSIGVGRTDWIRSPLPPNRTGGFLASGSPVDGLPATGLTEQGMGILQVEQPVFCKVVIGPAIAVPTVSFDPPFEGRQHALCPNRVFRPAPAEPDVSGLRSRFRHYRRLLFIRLGHDTPSSCVPLLPPELPGFVATMDALTPERRLFLPVGSHAGIRHMNTVLSVQVSLFHVSGLLSILSPTTPPSPMSLSHTTPQRIGLLFPVLSRRARNSRESLGFAIDSQAHRADKPKRVRILRAAPSPPVALHPASRRRSYSQLQAGVCLPEEDLHLSGQIRLQTHESRPLGAFRLSRRTNPGLMRPGLSNRAPLGLPATSSSRNGGSTINFGPSC
jgi:hypothetical protein